MKFSKTILAIAALFAISTITPASYLDRAKAATKEAAEKAKATYVKAEKAYQDLGGTEGVKKYYSQYYNQAEAAYDKLGGTEGMKEYYGQAKDMSGKATDMYDKLQK